jgi:hypothetical protein
MLVIWVTVFVGSLALAVVHIVRGRRRGDDVRTIVADSRLLMLGLPLSISLDHTLSRSEHMGNVAVAGSLLTFLSMLWFRLHPRGR